MTVGAEIPAEVLRMARTVLGDNAFPSRCHAAAILGRQALEGAVDELWAWKGVRMDRIPQTTQLLCIGPVLEDGDLGGQLHHAWARLSDLCHHDAYEIQPSGAELWALFDIVEAFIARTDVRGLRS